MIVVDANIFVYVMTAPKPDDDPHLLAKSEAFFRAAAAGRVTFTTSEAVIAEVVWVMTTRYGVERSRIASRLRGLLDVSGCRMPSRDLCKASLTTWVENAQLSFVDALVSTMAEAGGLGIVTLDRALARHTQADLWTLPSS